MNKEIEVTLEPITPETFAHFGQVIAAWPTQPPDNSGEGWRCWYPVGGLAQDTKPLIGIVESQPRPLQVSQMQRHLQREEWVFALDKPLIQTVALSGEDNPQQPDPHSLRAFLLQPGQGVLIEAGVWHAAGLPAEAEITFYGFVLGEALDDPQENSGWVKLMENTLVKINR